MMTIETRLENAVRRAQEEQVRPIRLGHGKYVVASSSQPGHAYLVHVGDDHVVACNCPAAEWDYPCKHAVAVQMLEQQQAA